MTEQRISRLKNKEIRLYLEDGFRCLGDAKNVDDVYNVKISLIFNVPLYKHQRTPMRAIAKKLFLETFPQVMLFRLLPYDASNPYQEDGPITFVFNHGYIAINAITDYIQALEETFTQRIPHHHAIVEYVAIKSLSPEQHLDGRIQVTNRHLKAEPHSMTIHLNDDADYMVSHFQQYSMIDLNDDMERARIGLTINKLYKESQTLVRIILN